MKYLSPLLSDARASIGGATASKNRGGNYFRARIAPIQPRTPAQQAIRSQLSSFSANWKALTQLQIAGWNALASTITLKDTLGNSYKPTGAQLYVGNNVNIQATGGPIVNDPPALKPELAAINFATATATAGTPSFIVTTGVAAATSDEHFLFRATPQLSPGISFIGQSEYRTIGVFSSLDAPSWDILADYNARYGALVKGANIGLQVLCISQATGFAGIPVSTSTIVAT
jgi:hypothetical protein